MSNEVIKPAEEKVDTENSATESTKQESTTETKAPANTEAKAPANTEATAPANTEAKAPANTEATAPANAAAPANAEAAAVVKTPEPTSETVTPEPPDAEAEEQDAGGEMDFGAMLAQFEQEQVAYHAGEIVSGKVVGIQDQVALVDFGYKSEGVVPIEEFTSSDGELTVAQGDEVEVMIKRIGGDGAPNLSYSDAKNRKSWDEIDQAFKDDTVVTGRITAKTKGGLKVDVQGVEAFLPGSQIDSRPIRNLDSLIGEDIEAKVVKFSRKRNNIVLSRKVITDLEVNKQKAETLAKIEEGFIVDGIVKNLTDYGVFIDIGGIDGLLHVTDMSWGRLQKPDDRFKVADTVQVKVLKLDREKEKVSLGYKQLLPDPWSTVTELYPVESKIKGRISSVTEYGAFVELEPGVEGLVHISEMSWAKRMKHPKHFVNKGDEVEVQVLGIDPDERRISLGIKQLQTNPWDTIGERFQVGSKVQGKVRNLTDFGAFVEIEDGIDGLVHVSDISWSKKIKHPKDVLKKGQEVEAVITNMDIPGHRLSLSIKELTPSAWDTFTNEHKPGDVVKGKISRFAGFGIFVELAPDLEGLCHISELSDDRIENPEDSFEVGQELDFKILRIEADQEKIGLSARAVGKENEPILDTKTYSSDAKGGMASLGELAKLNIGRKDDPAKEEEKAEETEKPVEAMEAKEETAEAKSTDKKEVKGEAPEAKEEAVEAKSSDKKEAKEEAAPEAKKETVEAKSSDKKEDKEKAAPEAKEETADAKASDKKEEVKEEAPKAADDAPDKADAKAEAAPEPDAEPKKEVAEAKADKADAKTEEVAEAKAEGSAETKDAEAKDDAAEEKKEIPKEKPAAKSKAKKGEAKAATDVEAKAQEKDAKAKDSDAEETKEKAKGKAES